MIPPFDPLTGNLPPGIHQASWEDFRKRFGLTPDRRALLDKLALAAEHLTFCGCQQIYVDGSFVTASDIPGDYDMCWNPVGVSAARLRDLFPGLWFTSIQERLLQRELYGGDIAPSIAMAADGYIYLDFFQRDKLTRGLKGIISLDLVTEI